MIDVVVAGQAYEEDVRRIVPTQALACYRGAREHQREVIAERRSEKLPIEQRSRSRIARSQLLGELASWGIPLLLIGQRAGVGGTVQERTPFLLEISIGRLSHM